MVTMSDVGLELHCTWWEWAKARLSVVKCSGRKAIDGVKLADPTAQRSAPVTDEAIH
jgi:hypothetical protein